MRAAARSGRSLGTLHRRHLGRGDRLITSLTSTRRDLSGLVMALSWDPGLIRSAQAHARGPRDETATAARRPRRYAHQRCRTPWRRADRRTRSAVSTPYSTHEAVSGSRQRLDVENRTILDMITSGGPDRTGAPGERRKRSCKGQRIQQPGRDRFPAIPGSDAPPPIAPVPKAASPPAKRSLPAPRGRDGLVHRLVDAEDLRQPGDPEDLQYPLPRADQIQRPVVRTHPLQAADQHPGRSPGDDPGWVRHPEVVPAIRFACRLTNVFDTRCGRQPGASVEGITTAAEVKKIS